ncbi:MAG: hypothetical protein D4R88_02700 [Methanosarcinales archaeon]|nr:MAG: hypothetical protein D4R88_02700 [Methanosarcinales archaeon]
MPSRRGRGEAKDGGGFWGKDARLFAHVPFSFLGEGEREDLGGVDVFLSNPLQSILRERYV